MSLCKDTLTSRHALTSKAAREAETCARRASRTAAAAEASHDSLSMRCRSRSSSSHARAVCSCIRLTASVKAACSLHTSSYISKRQHMYSAATYACNGRSRSDSASPAVCIRQHTSAYVSIVSIRQHTYSAATTVSQPATAASGAPLPRDGHGGSDLRQALVGLCRAQTCLKHPALRARWR
jgi:hypothetical protein